MVKLLQQIVFNGFFIRLIYKYNYKRGIMMNYNNVEGKNE